MNNERKKYIIGITLSLFECKRGVFFSFIRSDYALPYIKRITEKLQFQEESGTDSLSCSEEDQIPNKRSKFQNMPSNKTLRESFSSSKIYMF